MFYGAMNFPVRPILEEVEAIGNLGFDYLELSMDPPRGHYKIVRKQKKRLLDALRRLGMGLVCHLPTFLSTADLTESIRKASVKETLSSLELAADLRSLKVVLHPSYMGGLSLFVKDETTDYAFRSLEAIVKKADQLGLCLCIENLFPQTHSLQEPGDFVEIFKRFPSLKLTLDTGHAHIRDRGGRRALDFIEMFSDRIEHIHASDNFGKEDNHIPIGTGTVDYRRIVRALKKIGYNKTITLEVFSRDRDYLRISRDKLADLFAKD
ncbi:MAG: sugar phosphate isomerase/epimerase [Pseudomonadota bacterium]